jgi:NADH-quinone oxidoreductase subunit C
LPFGLKSSKTTLPRRLGAKVRQITVALDEVTVVVAAADYLESMRVLRDSDGMPFRAAD